MALEFQNVAELNGTRFGVKQTPVKSHLYLIRLEVNSFFLIYFSFNVYDCFAYVFLCAPYVCYAHEGKKSALDPLRLKL